MNKSNSEIKGFLILLAGGFLYSLYGVFSRIIGTELDNFFQYWTRSILILLILLILSALTKASLKKISKPDWLWVGIQALASGIVVPTFFIAINKLAIGTTIFTFYATGTIISYWLGALILKEKLTSVKLFSLFLAIIGTALMFNGTINLNNSGYIFLAGISGAFFGINITSVRKLQGRYSSLQLNIFNWIGVLILSIIISFVLGEKFNFQITSLPWIVNITLAICAFSASTSVVYGLKFIGVQKGSLILLSELIFGVLVGLLLFQEIPTALTIVGFVLVFLALLLPNLNLKFSKVVS